MSRIYLGLLLVLSVLVAAHAQPAPRRVAVVVGVGGYLNVPHLANPPRDATAIAGVLRRLGFDTTLVIDPDRAGLEQAIRTLGDKSRAADAAVFFYAGHALESDGHNYIVPVSAKVNTSRDLPFETVDIDLVGQQVEGRARTVIVFLDACRDNPFAINLSGRERGVKPGRGLAAPAADGSGTLIAFATAPGRTAEDGDGDDSPFTTALLKHLDTAGLEVRQMLALVRHDVREATGGKQIPWESSALEGSFYFHPGNAAQAASSDTDVADAASTPPSGSTRGAPSGDPASTPAARTPPSRPVAVPVVAPPIAPPIAPQIASRCRVGRIMGIRKPGGTETTMRIANDGRGCGFRVFVRVSDHVLFTSLVASTPPAHGRLVVNDNSQVIYWPKPGFIGEDNFVMDSVPHGSIRVRVIVRPAAADPA